MFTPNKPDTTVLYSGDSLKDAIDTMSSDMYHKTPVWPPLHAQLVLPDLNLEQFKGTPVPVPAVPKITMSPMKIYVLMCMHQGVIIRPFSDKASEALNELIDMQLCTYSHVTLKGMDYIKKLQEVQP